MKSLEETPSTLSPIRRYQVILTAIPEEPENDQEPGSNIADKSEQNLTICKENNKN